MLNTLGNSSANGPFSVAMLFILYTMIINVASPNNRLWKPWPIQFDGLSMKNCNFPRQTVRLSEDAIENVKVHNISHQQQTVPSHGDFPWIPHHHPVPTSLLALRLREPWSTAIQNYHELPTSVYIYMHNYHLYLNLFKLFIRPNILL